MTQHVLLDSQGNVVDTSDEPFVSDVPVSSIPASVRRVQEAPEPIPVDIPEYEVEDEQVAPSEKMGVGQGALAGLEEVNTMNPFGGLVRPIAAGLVAPFSDKTYGEIYKEMGERQEARKKLGRATEGGFKYIRKPTQAVGEALKPFEEIMMGQALLSGIAKTARGAQAIQALSKMPGVKPVGAVLSKTVGSRNPFVRAGSLAGVTGAGTAAYDMYKGENAATTIADSLSNAASIGLPVLGAGYFPASVFYPTMMAASAGKGYVARKGKGQETDFSDVLGDLAGGAAYSKLLRGEIIPEDTAVEKGSKVAKAVDILKSKDKIATGYIEKELDRLSYDDNTPFWKVPLKKTEDFLKHFRKIDQTKASTFGLNTIQPYRKELEGRLKGALNKEYPLVRETKNAQKVQSEILGAPAGARDAASLRNTDKRPIKASRIDKNLPPNTQIRQDFDREYLRQGGKILETEEGGAFYQRAPTHRAMEALGGGDPIQVKASNRVKKTLAYTKSGYKSWQDVDTPSHKSIVTVGEMKEAGTPQSDAYKAKNAIWNNERNELPKNLQVTGLGDDNALPPNISKMVKEYDHLVNAEKVLNADVVSPKELLTQAAAAAPAGRLAKYSVGTKLGERALQTVGKLSAREAAKTLSKMTVGDVKNLLRAEWGSSVPFVETISAVKNLPKRKEKRK